MNGRHQIIINQAIGELKDIRQTIDTLAIRIQDIPETKLIPHRLQMLALNLGNLRAELVLQIQESHKL